ncbi:NAD(P)-dependent oxidoreductase [Humitalea sp. 24SJ18S-53]|uniref:NAD(P)-dependent oxidoreductase n=1 Tax=Humitalea sp. 24SJ18S-53 TaxID=3422307 RepID=UPI003D66DD95
MSHPIRSIGFIGIGNMGWPMAARLVGAGFAVAVSDAVPGRAQKFVAEVGGSDQDIADADAIVTILPTSTQVAEVIAGLRASLRPGMVVIEMSSGQPSATQAIAADLAGLGIAMVDAPVSGGVARAVTGELAIMAGGEESALDRVDPVLRAMGTTITRVGPVGAGQAMKALNNLVSAAGYLIGIEALLMGQRFGLDPALMVDVLNSSTGMTNSSQKKFRQFVLSRGFDSGFGLDLMVKDLTIAMQLGRETGTPAPFAALCREMWAAAATSLGPGQDHTAVARLSEHLAGTELASPQVNRRG